MFLSTSALLWVCLWPALPFLCGAVRLIDNFICSWREEGDEYITYPLCVVIEWRGGVFSFPSLCPFLDAPQALIEHILLLTVTNGLIFWKARGRSLGEWGEGLFPFSRELLRSVRWYPGHFCNFLLCTNETDCAWNSRVILHIFGMWWQMLLCQICVMKTAAVQFP